jgi:hypothetical protein
MPPAATPPDSNSASGWMAAGAAQYERPAAAPIAEPAPAPAAPLSAPETPEPPAGTASPAALKDISIQVSQSGEDRVQVRLVQQAGELHVAVRTGEPALAHGLQQGLPELVGRLQENGFKTDVWKPAGSTSPAAAGANPSSASNQSGSRDSQTPSGWSQQPRDQRNPGQNQKDRPQWVEELESNLGTTGKFSGESHGIVS